jgi:hypothetical protein
MSELRKPRTGLAFFGMFLGLFILAYGYWYLVSTMPDPDALNECQTIVADLEASISFPQSVSSPGNPALFCDKGVKGMFLTKFDRVNIYGVLDTNEQQVVIDRLKNAKRRLKTKPIQLEFFEKENWKTWSDPKTGRSGGDRGPETPIWQAVIE